MIQLTIGFLIFMYILGSVSEAVGIVPKSDNQLKIEQKRACDRASDEEFILLSCRNLK